MPTQGQGGIFILFFLFPLSSGAGVIPSSWHLNPHRATADRAGLLPADPSVHASPAPHDYFMTFSCHLVASLTGLP